MKRTIILLLCAAGCSAPPPTQKPAAAVIMAKAQQQNVLLRLSYIGHVEANATVDVKAQVSGILTGKYYIDGGAVKQGDLLFTIDSRPYKAALEKAQALLSQNEANLKFAEEKAQRYSNLLQDDFVSKLDYDEYVTDVVVDEAVILQNRADIIEAELNVEYCTIRAPLSGITGKTLIDVGNYIQIGGNDPMVTLNQIEPIVVSFYVPEKDLPAIQCLQKLGPLAVHVYLNDAQQEPIVGQLTLIDNKVDEQTGTILLRATFANEDKALWPGQFVTVDLIMGCKENAVVLSSRAIKVGQQGEYVFVIKEDQTVEMRNVKTGQLQDDSIIIESGLAAGEKVVLEGQLNLFQGAPVTIKNGSQ